MHNVTAHAGWRQEEEQLLFEEAGRGRRDGMPLRAVFESVAQKTGRRPNSIRNYYYARVKQDARLASPPGGAAFVPFKEAEIDALLRAVLSAQAKGISVRACTLKLGGGDTKAMLRCQNKYRSLLKNDPARVKRVYAELCTEGIPALDPYARAHTSNAGRPRKRESLVEAVSDVIRDLNAVEGLDVTAFFESLGTLALAAGRGGRGDAALAARIAAQEEELRAARERFAALLALYRQLISVNREFLRMTGVRKMSSLSDYIASLSRNVEDCERLLPQFTESL